MQNSIFPSRVLPVKQHQNDLLEQEARFKRQYSSQIEANFRLDPRKRLLIKGNSDLNTQGTIDSAGSPARRNHKTMESRKSIGEGDSVELHRTESTKSKPAVGGVERKDDMMIHEMLGSDSINLNLGNMSQSLDFHKQAVPAISKASSFKTELKNQNYMKMANRQGHKSEMWKDTYSQQEPKFLQGNGVIIKVDRKNGRQSVPKNAQKKLDEAARPDTEGERAREGIRTGPSTKRVDGSPNLKKQLLTTGMDSYQKLYGVTSSYYNPTTTEDANDLKGVHKIA